MNARITYVWDYDIDETQFREMLSGRLQIGRLDCRWAAVRLIEYAPYREILRLLGWSDLLHGWPEWRRYVRSESRRRGFDFLAEWIPKNHPELLQDS